MVKKTVWLLVLFVLLLAFPILAAENDCLYYFYGDEGCDDCTEVDNYLTQLQGRHPSLKIERLEVYFNRDNLAQLQKFYDAYSVPLASQQVPLVIISGSYFVGKQSITELLEDRILDNDNADCPTPEGATVGLTGLGSSKNVLQTLTLPKITAAALSSSITFFTIILVIILFLLSAGIYDIKDWKLKSIIFLGGIVLVYFLFGLGLFSWFASEFRNHTFAKIISIIAIVLSIIIIKDFVKKKSVPTPLKIVQIQEFLVHPVSIFVIAVIGSLFTLAGSSTMLTVLRTLFKNSIGRETVVPLLVYYVFIFVLPLVLVCVILYYVRRRLHEEAKKQAMDNRNKEEVWKKHYFNVLHFVLAIVTIVISLVLLTR